MQEYQQQLMQQYQQSVNNVDNYSLPSSPPPTYRSRASTIRTGVHIVFPPDHNENYPNSLPPTYRSQTSSRPSLPRAGFDDEEEGYPIPEPIDPAPRESLVSDAVSMLVASNSMDANGTLGTLNQQLSSLNEQLANGIPDHPTLFSGRSQGTMTDPEGLLNPPSPPAVMPLTSAASITPPANTPRSVHRTFNYDQPNELCNRFTMTDNNITPDDDEDDDDDDDTLKMVPDLSPEMAQAGVDRTSAEDITSCEPLGEVGTHQSASASGSNSDTSRQCSPERDDTSPIQAKTAAETSL